MEVVFEDRDLIVVEKGAGVLSYPVEGAQEDSVIRLIRLYWKHLNRAHEHLYLLHRLDKETSGLMVFAKTSLARSSLRKQFEEHSVLRGYLAVVDGIPDRIAGKIQTFLGRDSSGRRAVSRKGKAAITRYEVVSSNPKLHRALVRCYLQTGRTHQVRIHMNHLDIPVIGDPVYGRRMKGTGGAVRMALHAEVLGFIHPRSRIPLLLRSSLPPELRKLLVSRSDCVDFQTRSLR